MLIDWFTVVAQGINFLVLVWLLKRYLYKPVLAAIDAREKQIARAIADAASQKTAAEQERSEFAAKKTQLDGESAALLKQAASAADTERTRLLAEVRAEANVLRVKQIAALGADQIRLRQSIAHLVQQEVVAIARQVLKDLAGASLEERVVLLFAQRLRTLDVPAKRTLTAAFTGASAAVVHSAFALAEAQRTLIQSAVDEVCGASIPLRFDVSAQTLCGVELLVGGQKLAWNLADYLDGLEEKLESQGAGARMPGRPETQAPSALSAA